MEITELFTYPIKSTRGISTSEVNVLTNGIENDRCVAVINSEGIVVTGRENPRLLHLRAYIENDKLIIKEERQFSFDVPFEGLLKEVRLFKSKVYGKLFHKTAFDYISMYLKGDFHIIYLDANVIPLDSTRGGLPGEFKSYADSSPIHLISKASLKYLNSKLKKKVGIRNFRPNIVVDGLKPFEEDLWSELEINGCLFRVQERTNRCIFTTVNPETLKKDIAIQPLASLAKLRMLDKAKPTFGIGLVPLNTGKLYVSNKVKVRN